MNRRKKNNKTRVLKFSASFIVYAYMHAHTKRFRILNSSLRYRDTTFDFISYCCCLFFFSSLVVACSWPVHCFCTVAALLCRFRRRRFVRFVHIWNLFNEVVMSFQFRSSRYTHSLTHTYTIMHMQTYAHKQTRAPYRAYSLVYTLTPAKKKRQQNSSNYKTHIQHTIFEQFEPMRTVFFSLTTAARFIWNG